jgi:hypothetical protein
MKLAGGGRRLEKLAGANPRSKSSGDGAPRRWKTVTAGKDPWGERGV